MIELPSSLKPFEEEAKEILKKGLIGDVQFSGETYQVEIIEPNRPKNTWTFIQLNDRGNLKDGFCSWEHDEEIAGCSHLAAAFLTIYNHHSLPLHTRFEGSLWNVLCKVFADRLGAETDQFIEKPKHLYFVRSHADKLLFYAQGKSQEGSQFLREIIKERKIHTEETSIKFTNLTNGELNLWRQGTPSAGLAYEISFWGDLAHWLMLQQEKGVHYTIDFQYDKDEIPTFITIRFPDIELGFYLSRANLPEIITGLATVQSPLPVYKLEGHQIESIVYRPAEKELIVHKAKDNREVLDLLKEGIVFNGWIYIKKKGVYHYFQSPLFEKKVLKGELIAEAFDKHLDLIHKYLKNEKISNQVVALSYFLWFDDQWSLHIEGYLFTPGDLKLKNTLVTGKWVYLENQGFFPIKAGRFDLEKIISETNVSHFVTKERNWLNQCDGFSTHLTPIETQVIYHVSDDNRLSFSKVADIKKDALRKSKEFGSWVYLEGKGFYSNMLYELSLPLKNEMTISEDQIPLFIQMNMEELKLIPSFFSDNCPIEKCWLNVDIEGKDQIIISPIYMLSSNYQNQDVRLFGEVAYVKGEGFSFLTLSKRLPEQYRTETIIKKKEFVSFFEKEFPLLQMMGAKINPSLESPKKLIFIINLIEKHPKDNMYHLQGRYESEKGDVGLMTVYMAIKQKQRFLFSKAGRIDISDARFDWLRVLENSRSDPKNHTIALTALELIKLNAFENLQIGSDTVGVKLFNDLNRFQVDNLPDISGLKSDLRPYQQFGVQWLWFLYNHQLSGLLCDDMGLGKTHQAMALIAAIINSQRENHGTARFLIICPTSVIYHWEDKLKEYFPNLRVEIFYGSERSLQGFSENKDVLLTSYGIWRNEHKILNQLSFELAILDEIQVAKNHQSRIHVSLRNIKAKMRVGLTGTPIENHLMELKALFDIVLPHYMPSEIDYRSMFVKPIQRENNPERKALLARFIKPFMLRRRKAEVLRDLPEKIEEISHCQLAHDQQVLYHEVLSRSRQALIEKLKDESSSIPYMHIFAVLSALKQICDHPAAYLKQPEEYKKYHSGKWDLFKELLHEAQDSQQKVVIFSQYLAMLDILEHYCVEQGIQYATIRGSTRNRGEQVQLFNTNPKCQVFIASLQAAGLGVDLTAGSVVIHYDRWWNAARENQATDRVHRIGQTRGVQVFKLVTKGTFEERIDELIWKKGQLMEEVVGVDDYRFMKVFDRTELIELLEDIEMAKGLT